MPKRERDIDFPGKHFAVDGHDLHFVSTAEERLEAVLKVIACARKSIRMLTYMFHDDQTGREVMEALLHARKRGLDVELMIDSFGSSDSDDRFFRPLKEAGGRFCRFSSRWNLGYIVRNHQKVLIADDAHILIGGYNITDQYFGRAGENSWEDFGVIASGPQVGDLAGYFDDLLDLSKDGGVRFLKLRKLIRSWKAEGGKLRWLIGGPTNRISPWALSLKRDLTDADSIHLAAAYFSPSRSIMRRIIDVTQKGNSRLVLAGKTDNGATIGAARSLYKYMLKRGARIFEYRPRPLHIKLLVIDDACYVGSANLDIRSLFINLEIMLRIEDAGVAEYLRSHIGIMIENSEEQTLEKHRKRSGLFSRLRWGLAYLLVNSIDYTIGRRIKFGLLRNTREKLKKLR